MKIDDSTVYRSNPIDEQPWAPERVKCARWTDGRPIDQDESGTVFWASKKKKQRMQK